MKRGNRVRILLVDDHALLRDALGERLHREDSLDVVGTASTAEEAIELARSLRPDIILMDIDMPGLTCFEAAKRILQEREHVRIVFLSAYTHDHYIEEALSVGAMGYLTKAEPPDRVISAIREVAEDHTCFSDAVLNRIVFEDCGAKLATTGKSRVSTLTNREVEILRYLARGLGKKEIARIVHVSTKTVDKHTENLMRKLDIHDRVELARFAIREGLAEA